MWISLTAVVRKTVWSVQRFVQGWLHVRSEPKYGGPTNVKSWCEAVRQSAKGLESWRWLGKAYALIPTIFNNVQERQFRASESNTLCRKAREDISDIKIPPSETVLIAPKVRPMPKCRAAYDACFTTHA